jgi:putative redox protein
MAASISVEVNQVGPTTSEGRARTHTTLIDRPDAKGGQDRGAMGGEYLLMALGGCFLSNLLAAVRTREVAVSDVRITVKGTLEESPPRFDAIEMIVSAKHEDEALLQKLVTISERACIVANTLKRGTDLSVLVE